MAKVVPAVAVMIVLLLAGCSGPSSPETPQEGRVTPVQGGGSVEVANGTGALVGTVLNDIGFTLGGVHLALLDTDFSASTSSDGRFVFTDLLPGPYTLRADHAEYRSVQETLEVPKDDVVEVEVVMIPRQSAGPGYREHIHDLWNKQDSIVIVDRTLRWAGHEAGYTGHHCLFASKEGVWEPPNLRVGLDEPLQTIYQATDRIEVVLDWETTDSHYDTLAFAWSGANSTHHWVSDWIAKSETFTIPVEPPMWDSSHQTFTLWDFWVCRDKNTPGSTEREVPFVGDVDVKMTMFRGDAPIPPEPAHPLFWQNGTELPVIEDTQKRFRFITGVGGIPQLQYERTGKDSRFMVRPDEGALVPPGTGRIEARLDWEYTVQGTPFPASSAQTTPGWSLTYKPASQMTHDVGGPGDLMAATLLEDGDGSAVYEIEVDSDDTDAFYQTVSNWYFYLNVAGEEGESTWLNTCACDITIDLNVTAYQRSDFEEG